MNGRHRESGQVLVIFAGGLLTLLVIAALVIDLGFTMAIRRSEQDAADAGAIAAARFIRTGVGGTAEPTRMRQAACFYAEQNGFFPSAAGNVDGCIPANDPNGTVLTVNFPPSAGGGSFVGTDGYVEVGLTRVHRSFLAGMVGLGSLRVSTSAVAAFTIGQSNSSSLIALDPNNDCTTGRTHGNGDITIHPVVPGTDGGYVHVNSTCGTGTPDTTCGSTSSPNGALVLDGNGTITAPAIYVSGTCKASGTLVGPLTEGAVQIGDPLAELPPPAVPTPDPGAQCGVAGPFTAPTGSGSHGCSFNGSATVNLLPGVYYGGWKISGHPTLVLAPGIYTMAGEGIQNSGGSITSVQGGAGAPAPVLIFNTDNPVTHTGQGPIDLQADSTLSLHAIDTGPYKGILVWNDGKGSNPTAIVSLGGQTNLDIAGTIYSPKGLVNMEGGSGVAGSTNIASIQIIAWKFDVGGNGTLDMPYDPAQLYQFPAKGLVH